jgi:hypothetical protein
LKKLSNKLQPFKVVYQIIYEILQPKKNYNIRFLLHLLSYAEHQFGEPIPTIGGNRERVDGDRISTWNVDTTILNEIYKKIVFYYSYDTSLSTYICNDLQSPYLERSLHLLNPWLIYLDSDASIQINNLDEEFYREKLDKEYYINRILTQLYLTESKMVSITLCRRQYDLAEGHCQRCLAYSRRFYFEGEEKISAILKALSNYCTLRGLQGEFSGGLTFAEEGYFYICNILYIYIYIYIKVIYNSLVLFNKKNSIFLHIFSKKKNQKNKKTKKKTKKPKKKHFFFTLFFRLNILFLRPFL